MDNHEDSYGRIKREEFVSSVILDVKPKTVLDFGCGTGTQLTIPIAKAHPDISFIGVDSDQATIDWANRQPVPPNLQFLTSDNGMKKFELVIASEVLEHVDSPSEFLSYLRQRMTNDGSLLITTPNGYGPFEAAALFENTLTVIGILPLVRGIKRRLRGMPQIAEGNTMTLAVSPHLQFFSRRDLDTLFAEAGLRVVRYRPRTVFCGFLFDRIIRGPLLEWNGRIADRLPAWCASDWMFVCKTAPVRSAPERTWRPNNWARFRRWLSERRWAGVTEAYH